MNLADVWFVIIAVFWTGFFVLEGFDFGVGALHSVIGRSEAERRTAINTIAPFWDGNEVWLVVGVAGIFAAFPAWYATWLSALYLGVVLLLVALIARGVSIEWRGKGRSGTWRGGWSFALTAGSVVAPLVLGIALGDLLAGLPINEDGAFTGRVWSFFTGFGVWTGLTLVALCLLHGATFLAIRTTDELRQRATRWSLMLGVVALVMVVVFAVWTVAHGTARMAGVSASGGRVARDRRRLHRIPARKREGRIRGDGNRDRGDGRLAVRQPLPRTSSSRAPKRLQPHHRRQRVGRLRAHGDDDRRRCLLPDRAALSGLHLRRAPQARRGRPDPRRTDRGTEPRRPGRVTEPEDSPCR